METIKNKNDYKITLSIPQSATKKEVYDELKQKIDLTFSEKTDDYEIPFGAKDSELKGWEYTIPDGFEAEIKDGKVIVKEEKVSDEQVRRALIDEIKNWDENYLEPVSKRRVLAWLKKQKEQRPTELPKGEDYGIDGLYAAIDILQKTLGEVDGYQTDDGILEHKCAISAVKELCEQKSALPAQVAIDAVNHGFERVSDFEKGKEEVINDPEKYGLCKPAEWSDKDKQMLISITDIIEEECPGEYIKTFIAEMVHWLQALPERFSVQHKQEWSEEDEEMLRIISNRLDKFNEWATEQGYPIDDPTMKQTPIDWLKALRPQKKQNYSGLSDFERAIHRGFLCAGVENVPRTIIEETAQDALAQIKPAEWSEEDEKMMDTVLGIILYDKNRHFREGCQIYANWLKSLPDRIHSDTETDWCEEDEKHFNSIVAMAERGEIPYTSDIDWIKTRIKSLRPQPKQEDRYMEGFNDGYKKATKEHDK